MAEAIYDREGRAVGWLNETVICDISGNPLLSYKAMLFSATEPTI